jgi:hypothetical protein
MQVQFARNRNCDGFVIFFGWHCLILREENQWAIKKPAPRGTGFSYAFERRTPKDRNLAVGFDFVGRNIARVVPDWAPSRNLRTPSRKYF